MDPKTREERLAEFRRLFDADKLDEASALLQTIPPITLEELRVLLDEAELEDEELSPTELEAIQRADERRRRRQVARTAG
jgi:hypothetical protein